jgi:hypothetical protein
LLLSSRITFTTTITVLAAAGAGALLMLLGLLPSSGSAYAETFIAVHNGGWNEPSTWKDGIAPSTSLVEKNDTVIIPCHVSVGSYSWALHNSGNIIVNGTWYSSYPLTNEQDGTIKVGSNGKIDAMDFFMILDNKGKIYNAGGFWPSYLYNSGIINNTGYLGAGFWEGSSTQNYKNGTIINYNVTGLQTSENEGTIVNHGRILIDGGPTLNSGKMNNTGTVILEQMGWPYVNSGIFNNYAGGNVTLFESIANSGVMQNDGIITIANSKALENHGYMVNSATGIINNTSIINNTANMDNVGTIQNHKTMENTKTGIINNIGKIKNYGEIKNAGTLNNSNTIDNAGVITILNSGRLVNSAYINNNSIGQGQKGKIINSSGTLINAGLVQ